MSFAATFSLDPSKFPYTKQTITTKRNCRIALQSELFFDLVLAEVAQIPHAAKLYPPRNISDLRSLHDAIESCPVDLLKKQCCIYYILRDWNTQAQYAQDQLIPSNYCKLMDSYWFLDNEKHNDALLALTSPGLSPNFATKIMTAFRDSGNDEMLVTYVRTLQPALDSDEKVGIYLSSLMKVDVSSALFFTRTVPAQFGRRDLFVRVLEYAKSRYEDARIIADFPFDAEEEDWTFEVLSKTPGIGLEALVLRLTMMGRTKEVVKLREVHGGGRHDLNEALTRHINDVELKLMQESC